MVDRADVVAAHRQLREASDAVQHLLVVEDLTQQQIDDAAIALPGPTSRSKTSTRQFYASDLTRAGPCLLALQFSGHGSVRHQASDPAAPPPYGPCSVGPAERVVLHNPNARPVKQASLITTRRHAVLARP